MKNHIEKWLELWRKDHSGMTEEEERIVRAAWAFQQGTIYAMDSKIQAMETRIETLESALTTT